MRILYTITKSEAGGAQTRVYQLAEYFTREGHEVAVMAYPGDSLEKISNSQFSRLRQGFGGQAISNQFSNSNFQTSNRIKFYPNKYFKNSYNPFLGLRAMREVRKAVIDFKPDIVHCHSTVAGFWTRLSLRQGHSAELSRSPQGKPRVIFTAHGWGFTEGASFFRKILIPFAEKIAAKYCDKIICVSEYDKELALKYKITTKDKLITIYNGVEVTNYKLQITNKSQIPNSKLQIVFVGRLDEPKKPELLLKAFSELSDDIKARAEVLIVGEGSKKEFLISNFKFLKNVKFLGGLTREKVFEVLRESDVFVLTSNYEGFPITILEAMSCELPIIASDVGGIKEALTPEIGFLIKRPSFAKSFGRVKDNVEELKKALTELIENKELREKMGREARERMEKEFSLEKMLSKTENVYNIAIQ